jgi:hypothetical protein
MNELLDRAVTMVRDAGFQPEVRQRRHFHVCWTDPDGREHRLIVPRSPSDWRALSNMKAELRRRLRETR